MELCSVCLSIPEMPLMSLCNKCMIWKIEYNYSYEIL